MPIKAIKYRLYEYELQQVQPYWDIAEAKGMSFEGGFVVEDGWYLGILTYPNGATGTKKLNDLVGNVKYNCTVMSNADAIAWFTKFCKEYEDFVTWEKRTVAQQVADFTSKLW